MRRSADRVSEQSLLEEMRAAVRGDRQRAEQRRAEPSSPVPSGDPAQAEQEAPDAPDAPTAEERSLWRRVTRRRQTA